MTPRRLLLLTLLALALPAVALDGRLVYAVVNDGVVELVAVDDDGAVVFPGPDSVEEVRDLDLAPDGLYAALWYYAEDEDRLAVIPLRRETTAVQEPFPGADPHWSALRELEYRVGSSLYRWNGLEEPALIAGGVDLGVIRTDENTLYFNELDCADWIYLHRDLEEDAGTASLWGGEPFREPELDGGRLLVAGGRRLYALDLETGEETILLESDDAPRCPSRSPGGDATACLLGERKVIYLVDETGRAEPLLETAGVPAALDWGPVPPPPPEFRLEAQ